ncbi:putative ATP-dependent RNA helicase PB1A10.06c [Erysiphe neolycopersici]|uniref:RNA helicase n=1 Tax=Erysiphe neolycopersici TaxID=212602 RepID=A0A420HIC5_9PEZI|nr:putative ATP-dependent RNA helicase PB1A10.06c [Erysiphe neolycopersici]
MPPKFVPRQRKHKVIARQKVADGNIELKSDSNASELIPLSKSEIQEKKRQIRDSLRKDGIKISSKKAKRLEKYLETKLRKDENRKLISQLAEAKSDTSLYYSSSKLGQGKLTKKQHYERDFRSQDADINVNVNEDKFNFDESALTENEVDVFSSDDSLEKVSKASILTTQKQTGITVGVGLRRPLQMSKEGLPILGKRKRRGGIVSKFSLNTCDPVIHDDSEWNGFSSDSTMFIQPNSMGNFRNSSEGESGENDKLGRSDDSSNGSTENSSDESETSNDSDEVDVTPRKERSAFKAWAIQQINEAQGYQSVPNIQSITSKMNVPPGFKPRALEEDPLPSELKPTTNTSRKSYSITVTRPLDVQKMRLGLPIVAEEQKIMESIFNNNTVIICGATGSGKTTQVPQFLFEAGYGSSESPTPGMIGVTQPRRVAAVSMTKRLGDELGDYGKKAAYQIRFEGTVSSETAIKFMTDGVLLREIAQDIALRKYSAIIIDEAHERSVNTDILIGMLSRIVKLREEMSVENSSIYPLKFIIMSATIRIKDFTENTSLFTEPPPVIEVGGRQFPVTCHFSRRTSYNYVEEAFRKICRGHKKLPPGSFLVFLTSQNDIFELSKLLNEAFRTGASITGPKVKLSGKDVPIEIEDVDFGEIMYDKIDEDYNGDSYEEVDINIQDDDFNVEEESEAGPLKMHILPLYSLLPTKEQLRVFEPPPNDSRLVILATNVAETSLTIPGVRYVFDCGRSKERKFDKVTGVQSFEIGWISKASAQQRAGRAGRTAAGHCYRLYSSAIYERDFPEVSEPEILRMPIEGVVLQLKAMNLQQVVNFPFPTPPDRNMLEKSEKLLKYLMALSTTGKITSTGLTMSIFPLPPRLSRILLIGHLHDCLPYTIALVSGLSVSGVFLSEREVVPDLMPRDDTTYLTNSQRIEEDLRADIRRRYNKAQKGFCFLDDKSDAIKLLQAVGEFAHEPTEAWCQAHFVRYKTLREIQNLRRQITDLLRINIDAFAALKYEERLKPPSEKQVRMLKQMVAAGFIDHIAIRADICPNPPVIQRKPTRAIDVPYLTLFPSNINRNEEDHAVYIHPESPLAHLSPQECPEYVAYSYLQRAATKMVESTKASKTRMHCLTDITGNQLAALTKGTPLLHYGKPLKQVLPKVKSNEDPNVRECWVIPFLRPESNGGSIGWPLPARKVTQRKIPGRGWIVE